jgi:hypothetical protein
MRKQLNRKNGKTKNIITPKNVLFEEDMIIEKI